MSQAPIHVRKAAPSASASASLETRRPVFQPTTQPKGPDGTKGFQLSRTLNPEPFPLPLPSAQPNQPNQPIQPIQPIQPNQPIQSDTYPAHATNTHTLPFHDPAILSFARTTRPPETAAPNTNATTNTLPSWPFILPHNTPAYHPAFQTHTQTHTQTQTQTHIPPQMPFHTYPYAPSPVMAYHPPASASASAYDPHFFNASHQMHGWPAPVTNAPVSLTNRDFEAMLFGQAAAAPPRW